jgi:CheY-like chemotaxis protein
MTREPGPNRINAPRNPACVTAADLESHEPSLAATARCAGIVVLLDIGMPEMNGYDVARGLRAGFPDTPAMLVALTGSGRDYDRRRAREAVFDHHLGRPADIDTLQELLGSLAADGSSLPDTSALTPNGANP